MTTPHFQWSSRIRAMLDVVATVLTIGTCMFVCGLLALRVFGNTATQSNTPIPALAIGSVLTSSADAAYSSSELTVLVGLSSNCRFCAESMPALRQLNDVVRSSTGNRVRVLAVGLESAGVLTRYLQENGLTAFRPTSVKRESEMAPVASRTPTLVLVDRAGKVLVSWTGRMTASQMNDVVKLNHIGSAKPD